MARQAYGGGGVQHSRVNYIYTANTTQHIYFNTVVTVNSTVPVADYVYWYMILVLSHSHYKYWTATCLAPTPPAASQTWLVSRGNNLQYVKSDMVFSWDNQGLQMVWFTWKCWQQEHHCSGGHFFPVCCIYVDIFSQCALVCLETLLFQPGTLLSNKTTNAQTHTENQHHNMAFQAWRVWAHRVGAGQAVDHGAEAGEEENRS